MPSIALFAQTFTDYELLEQLLSAELDFPVVTDGHIISNVSAENNVDEKHLRNTLYKKTSVFNQFTLDKERHVNLLKKEIASHLLKLTQSIHTGFHTLLIPKSVTHVLKVLIADEKSQRIAKAVADGFSEKEAKRLIKQDDISSYAWTDFLFHKEAIDRSLYDIVLPVSHQSLKDSVKLIVENFHKTSVLETSASQQAVADMLLAALIEEALLKQGHNVEVIAHQGDITLEVNKSVFNFKGLTNELTQIAQGIPGVVRIEVIKGKEYQTSIYRSQRFELPSKVLLVDDEKDLIQTVSERLISRDVGAYAVFDGQQALDFIDNDTPEIIVLDLKMPGIDGIEVLRRTKLNKPEIEVIILTGHGTEADRKTCLELGAYAYLQKPVDLEKLSTTIKAANVKIRQAK